MPTIETLDIHGESNGWLLPIWHVDSGVKVEQVYLTVVNPGCFKGPHLHLKRRGLLSCIRGVVTVVTRLGQEYHEQLLCAGVDAFEIPPGVAAAIYNTGDEEAFVLNMPSPPWRKDEPDEHKVKDWTWEPVSSGMRLVNK